jgi:hypothetical protein
MNASTGIRVVYSKSSSRWRDLVTQGNRELWLVLSLFVIAGLLNWLVASHGMVLVARRVGLIPKGRAGIHFLEVPTAVSERLQLWRSERMSALVPRC